MEGRTGGYARTRYMNGLRTLSPPWCTTWRGPPKDRRQPSDSGVRPLAVTRSLFTYVPLVVPASSTWRLNTPYPCACVCVSKARAEGYRYKHPTELWVGGAGRLGTAHRVRGGGGIPHEFGVVARHQQLDPLRVLQHHMVVRMSPHAHLTHAALQKKPFPFPPPSQPPSVAVSGPRCSRRFFTAASPRCRGASSTTARTMGSGDATLRAGCGLHHVDGRGPHTALG